jgi:hypothetical protein
VNGTSQRRQGSNVPIRQAHVGDIQLRSSSLRHIRCPSMTFSLIMNVESVSSHRCLLV